MTKFRYTALPTYTVQCISTIKVLFPWPICFSGCGDHTLQKISLLPDPCPLPEEQKKRSLNERERLIYAPFSGVGGVVYDKVLCD